MFKLVGTLTTIAAVVAHAEAWFTKTSTVLEPRALWTSPRKWRTVFALEDFPRWLAQAGQPYVEVRGTVKAGLEGADQGSSVLRVIHVWSNTVSEIEQIKDMIRKTDCSTDPDLDDFAGFESHLVRSDGSDSVKFATRLNVAASAKHFAAFTNCRDTALDLDVEVETRNSFGYLTWWDLGVLEAFAFLSLASGILGISYIRDMVWNRQHLLSLHYATISVVLVFFGLNVIMFFSNMHENSSGRPALSAPWKHGFARLQISMAGSLLLVACLGWGIVKPKLDLHTILRVASLAVGFVFTGVYESTFNDNSWTTFIVSMSGSICGIVMISWIQKALSKIIVEVRKKKQAAKLKHFKRLDRLYSLWLSAGFYAYVACFLIFFGDFVEAFVAAEFENSLLAHCFLVFLITTTQSLVLVVYFGHPPSPQIAKCAMETDFDLIDLDSIAVDVK